MDAWRNRPSPDSSGGQVLELLARNGSMTTSELGKELGVTITAVRQHVNRLLADGWIEKAIRRSGRGRPAHCLSLSDQGKQAHGTQMTDLSNLMLDEIVKHGGPEAAKRILRGVGQRMAERMGGKVGSGSVTERMHALADLCRGNGILMDVCAPEEGVSLRAHTCPFYEVAGRHREICEMERDMIRRLVGREITLSQCMLDGEQCCTFEVALGV